MEKLEKYRQLIKEMFLKYRESRTPQEGVEVEVILDTERDHYQIMHVGWNRQNWIHGCVIHMDIKNEKIWALLNACMIRPHPQPFSRRRRELEPSCSLSCGRGLG